MLYPHFLQRSAHSITTTLLISLSLAAALICPSAQAQANSQAPSLSPPVGTAVQLQSPNLTKKAFDLKQLRGKVVLLVVWRTDCAVCREQMRELRDNTKGWDDKPFATVLVSTDASMAELNAYNQLINQLVPPSERLEQLWLHEPQFKDNLSLAQQSKLSTSQPLYFVIDQRGVLLERHSGRLPATVWERIAFLL